MNIANAAAVALRPASALGWHKLTAEEYEAKLAAYKDKQAKKAEAAE